MRNNIRLGLNAMALMVALGGASNAATLNDGLLAWYPFDGNANDETGNGNDGAVSNAALTQDRFGNADAAYDFNGTDSRIDVGGGLKPALPYSINLWFNAESSDYSPLFRNDNVDAGSSRFGSMLSVAGDQQIFLQHFSGFSVFSTRYGVNSDTDSFNLGDWTMVTAITGAPGAERLFINGVEAIVTPNTGTGTQHTYSGGTGAIGQVTPTPGNLSAFANTSFNGEIDDVGFWNRVLTPDEITMLYNGVDPLGTVSPPQPPTTVPLPGTLPAILLAMTALGIMRRRTPAA